MEPETPKYYCYLVRCADGSLYCGVTTDLERRVKEHNSGLKGAKYVRARRPVTLVYAEPCGSRADALRREIEIKKLTRAAKEALLHNSSV